MKQNPPPISDAEFALEIAQKTLSNTKPSLEVTLKKNEGKRLEFRLLCISKALKRLDAEKKRTEEAMRLSTEANRELSKTDKQYLGQAKELYRQLFRKGIERQEEKMKRALSANGEKNPEEISLEVADSSTSAPFITRKTLRDLLTMSLENLPWVIMQSHLDACTFKEFHIVYRILPGELGNFDNQGVLDFALRKLVDTDPHFSVIEALLKKGANPSAKGGAFKHSAIKRAQSNNLQDLVSILQKHIDRIRAPSPKRKVAFLLAQQSIANTAAATSTTKREEETVRTSALKY